MFDLVINFVQQPEKYDDFPSAFKAMITHLDNQLKSRKVPYAEVNTGWWIQNHSKIISFSAAQTKAKHLGITDDGVTIKG